MADFNHLLTLVLTSPKLSIPQIRIANLYDSLPNTPVNKTKQKILPSNNQSNQRLKSYSFEPKLSQNFSVTALDDQQKCFVGLPVLLARLSFRHLRIGPNKLRLRWFQNQKCSTSRHSCDTPNRSTK